MTDYSLLLEDPPRGWMQARLDDICRRVQDAASPSANGQRLYLGLEHLASGLPTLVGRGKESDVRSGKTTFRKDDILFGKLRPYLRKSVLVSEDGICSTDILVFRATEKCIPEFLCLLTHTDEFVGHSKKTTSGVQHPRTSWAALREFKLYVPPLPEQRKIAAVLGQVQQAIEQQERLIALTTELKKTLLHQLFTQGLHGEPQKQTEIGPVPESWKVVRLDSLFRIQQGKQVSKKNRIGDNQCPFLRTKNVFWGRLDLSELDEMYFTEAEEKRLTLQPGDLLVCEGGDIGRTAMWNGELAACYHQNHLHRVRAVNLENVEPAFLMYWLWYAFEFGHLYFGRGNVTTIPNLSQSKLAELPIPYTQLNEQREIVAALDALSAKEELHKRKHALLSDLFRTLLHQLMTAQIRVNDIDLTV
ncbi:MAG: restriction endonuclease subunit S [Nitrospirae bacterium]|nr:restriction endonuclease subunit S [Nitrospirota bacterium]